MHTFAGNLPSSTTGAAPEITFFPPVAAAANGMGLVIFPGGGYGHLAEHEGAGYAEFFSRAGLACFVVRYRLGTQGHRHPAMLEDALAAIHTVRTRADEFRLNPARLGVIGSSAGGHLAAHALTAFHRYTAPVPLRPDFGILCYPAATMTGPFAHAGSRANLLGAEPAPERIDEVSCDLQVSAQTPPCFLWHTGEDQGVPVENSLLFAAALRRHGVPFELHVYQKGPHGLGLRTDLPWGAETLRWLHGLFPA